MLNFEKTNFKLHIKLCIKNELTIIYLVKLFLLKLILLGNNIFLYIENDVSTSTEVVDAYFIKTKSF